MLSKRKQTLWSYDAVWPSRAKLYEPLENFKLPKWFPLNFYLTDALEQEN